MDGSNGVSMGLNLDQWALTLYVFGVKITKDWATGQHGKHVPLGRAKVARTVFLGHTPIFPKSSSSAWRPQIGLAKRVWLVNTMGLSPGKDQVKCQVIGPNWARVEYALGKAFLELVGPQWLGEFLLN